MIISRKPLKEAFEEGRGLSFLPLLKFGNESKHVKFLCTCGHVIRDQTDSLPYKAQFLPDEDDEAVFEAVIERLEAFMTARETGKQDEFLRTHFGETYPKEIDTKSILNDLLLGVSLASRFIYECENCGRVFIQKHSEYGKNIYATYLPEGDIRGVLQSQRERRL